jgi:hypothetical protein
MRKVRGRGPERRFEEADMKMMSTSLFVLGLASAASAADNRWIMTIEPTLLIYPGDYVEVSVYAQFGDGNYAFAGAELNIVADDAAGEFFDIQEHLGGPGAFAGSADGPMVTGIVTGQEHNPGAGVFADTTNPLLVWSGKYTTTDFSFRVFWIETETTLFDVYIDDDGNRESGLNGFVEGRDKVAICACPAPAAGVVLGALGIRAARRARPSP